MKKVLVTFGLFLLVAMIALLVAGLGNYSPSHSVVEGNVAGTFVADGSPRPPIKPFSVADGSPRPPIKPLFVADGSRGPTAPTGLAA